MPGIAYLDMLQNYLFPQLNELQSQDFIWQQDGDPTHCLHHVRDWLNDVFPQRWIGRAGPNDIVYNRWSPWSPQRFGGIRLSAICVPCDELCWH